MGYQPRTAIKRCPGCGQGAQFMTFRSLFSCDVRLECICGVAGQWRRWSPDERREPWRDAAEGWAAVFGQPDLPRPPPPMGMSMRPAARTG